MSDNLSNLETAVTARLATTPGITPELVRTLINKYRILDDFCVDDEMAEQLARTLETRFSVTMSIGSVLTEHNYRPWLESERANIEPYYWDRYKKLLLHERHFSPQVISSLDDVTNRVLGLLENPTKAGAWDRRGMVVGHVQSGKTSNYIGLIAKAADAGYKVIIVIAGIHNNLRNQTQLRIDEGFVGRDSSRLLSKKGDVYIGVGRFDQRHRPATFTNSKADFNKRLATGVGIDLQTLKDPAVFVIKKNATTLKNLLEWLHEHSARGGGEKIDLPMLLIDDEADNASINIAQNKEAASRINSQLRQLLHMFERSCYIGYTATPFANIFIDPDTDHDMLGQDLFPRNFIVSLDPPSNYFGATRVFVDESDQILRDIDDNDSWLPLKHQKLIEVNDLPPSLIEAIRTFVVAKAIRLARGDSGQHSSMLVNVSRFTAVQKQVRNEIHYAVKLIEAGVRLYSALSPCDALKNPEIAALKAVWQQEDSELEFDWETVQHFLLDAVAPINVVEVNSNSAGALNYVDHPDGLSVIAVGGFSLSRGLTLEGLMVSYFLRNSMMYDTLMQMGRWFGYRPNYDDLCRIWMLEDAQGWYEHITDSIEELRDDLRRMEKIGATPQEFGLKVRAHPEMLIVTARNKMKTTEKVVVQIGLGGKFIETTVLSDDERVKEANRSTAQRFAGQLEQFAPLSTSARLITGGWLVSDVPAEPILNFISRFQNHEGSLLSSPTLVVPYIADRQETELQKWDVLFASIKESSDPDPLIDYSTGLRIFCQRRNARREGGVIRFAKQRISTRGIEKTGLSGKQILIAQSTFEDDPRNADRIQKSGKPYNYPDYIYRRVRTRPLLIIHFLSIGSDRSNSQAKPNIAWSISFPETATQENRIEYVASVVWLKENYGFDLDDDEMGGDDA